MLFVVRVRAGAVVFFSLRSVLEEGRYCSRLDSSMLSRVCPILCRPAPVDGFVEVPVWLRGGVFVFCPFDVEGCGKNTPTPVG